MLLWFFGLVHLQWHTTIGIKAIIIMSSVKYILAIHALDYIVLKVKFGLTSCEELATPLCSHVWKASTLTYHKAWIWWMFMFNLLEAHVFFLTSIINVLSDVRIYIGKILLYGFVSKSPFSNICISFFIWVLLFCCMLFIWQI